MGQFKTCVGQQLIDSRWEVGEGTEARSESPVDGRICWAGAYASASQAAAAVQSAKTALTAWRSYTLEAREAVVREFAGYVDLHRSELAELISWETGKPLWESMSEVATVIGKVSNAIDALKARRCTTQEKLGDLQAVTRYKPHGVMVVLGPFNLPAHLPGAHIVPALLAGNTVVFKPSELTPAVGQWLADAWRQTMLPDGAFNLVHGDAAIAQALASDDDVAGVLFTGSYRAGASLHKLLGGRPEKILALEMGGNNPLVVHRAGDLAAAVMQIIESAYITSGQRCTCARRLILTPQSQPDRLIELLGSSITEITVGLPLDQPSPFMGTLVRPAAADRMLEAQAQRIGLGARTIVPMHRDARCSALLTPGLLDMTGIPDDDVEHFGPMLSVIRVDSFDEAISAANNTRFGLAAGLLTDHAEDYHQFVDQIRAGIVNWNRQTTGASGRLPFGGIGASGNHMPSGFFASDYCAYPVASLEAEQLPTVTGKFSPGLEGAARACSSN